MPTETDPIARAAARYIVEGEETEVATAIARAMSELQADPPAPSPGRVRQHVQAMSMEAVGQEAYEEHVREVLSIAEQLMGFLVTTELASDAVLAGRAAKGLVDAGVTLFVRAYTDVSVSVIADHLVDLGYDEPLFETVASTAGRLERLRFEEEGCEVVLTLCPRNMRATAALDLVTGEPLVAVSLDELRTRLKSVI